MAKVSRWAPAVGSLPAARPETHPVAGTLGAAAVAGHRHDRQAQAAQVAQVAAAQGAAGLGRARQEARQEAHQEARQVVEEVVGVRPVRLPLRPLAAVVVLRLSWAREETPERCFLSCSIGWSIRRSRPRSTQSVASGAVLMSS